MAGSINKATILGHLGQDPDIRSTQQGIKIANLSVATSESWNDKSSGEKREKTEWHRVVIFGAMDSDGLAGIAEKYLRKGSKVYVEGKIQTRKWQDQSGQDRYSTEIVLQGFGSQLVLLDNREGGNRPPAVDSPDAYGTSKDRPQANRSDAGGGFGDLDQDIPF
ncbi:single-stranded DNA-binding protein [Devosia algicola]|uniref:Single-stranded DNA-binding protein n=1 Tax=Devosia algicola TaxID=3026418 RepID=A0ABY7YR36_9HYPH|nr:single-stranded DNA-binding protein [Devosia algicola]WDR03647.1 single-stranded DNA-binding protein [Devosia algicola]